MLDLHFLADGCIECGCDEAGRGSLVGDVFAAAVILPEGFCLPELNDSKKLTERTRYRLRPQIEEQAVAWAVGGELRQKRLIRTTYSTLHFWLCIEP